MIFRLRIMGRFEKTMDKETREYLDQKYVGLARKEDIEKVRQETKASFRQWKEENKTQGLEWKQEISATIEESRKQWGTEIGALRDEILKGLEEVKGDTESALRQSNQGLDASFQKVREEAQTVFDHSKRQMDLVLNSIKEEGKKDLLQPIQEARSDLGGLKTGLNQIQEQAKQLVEEMGTLNEKVRSGMVEVKEELGAMIKFSYADLERKLNALEARIKVLEKIVLH